ncbi:MAG: nucleoside hydrolase, partial [Gammaproteobacteria bacterium]|nr:nucleoside hydrolase [Gammaproteobacteria bacterium]
AIIFDTDISSDVDDAGAVAVLHALADQGTIEILAMMTSSGDPWSGPCLDALNTRFGRPDIPIATIDKNAVTHVSKYTQYLAEEFPHNFPSGGSLLTPLQLYRKTLAEQPPASVTLVTVGYLSNLATLLHSGPDQYSPLTGIALIKEKVKQLVCMGGQFPSGREWNMYQDTPATIEVVQSWPTTIIFCGFEIGNTVMTGRALRAAEENHPLRQAYLRYNNLTDRQSWDQVAVLLAASPKGAYQLSPAGRVQVDQKGSNNWQEKRGGLHHYMLPLKNP